MNAATMINDYERLRSVALASRSASGTCRRSMPLVDQGLHAWLMGRSGAQPITSASVASGRTVHLMQRHDMVQLLASMALRSLTEDTHVYLQ